MGHFDIFNGDADGIFSLIQLRKHTPLKSQKITGIKRDIQLLKRCPAKGNDTVTVLDISMEKNLLELEKMLAQGTRIFYADHHRTGDIPSAENLEVKIDLSADTCTSLIIDDYLEGKYKHWALAGAFGDNLNARAECLAQDAGLSVEQIDFLKALGVLVNYNGYGESISDLHYAPEALYEALMQYESPFDLLEDKDSPYFLLRDKYQEDMEAVQASPMYFSDEYLNVYILPNEAASRRVSGVFANDCANKYPEKCHLILTENQDHSFTVSMRAPLKNKQGADVICSQYPMGGGRAGAAGINQLPKELIEDLIETTLNHYK